jgi:hypothetical protein
VKHVMFIGARNVQSISLYQMEISSVPPTALTVSSSRLCVCIHSPKSITAEEDRVSAFQYGFLILSFSNVNDAILISHC